MLWSIFLLVGVVSILNPFYMVVAFVFDVEFEPAMEPCTGKEDKLIDSIFDISQMELFRTSDINLMANGTFTILREFAANKPVGLKTFCQCKKRGMWVTIPFTYTINDFCSVEYKEDEFWYPIAKTLVGAQRECPPAANTVYNINELTIATRVRIPVRVDEGEYKCEVHVTHGGELFICGKLYGEVHEVL